MRYIILFGIFIFPLAGFSQTQKEMNITSGESFKKADKELNEVYALILKQYKEDTAFINHLKISQRIWITFRDAELKVKYPESDPSVYSSVYPVCASDYLEKLTKERTKTIKQWLNGYIEGDACNGSIKQSE